MNKYDKLWAKQGIKHLNINYNKEIFYEISFNRIKKTKTNIKQKNIIYKKIQTVLNLWKT